MKRGLFIVFEGADGSGKSTQMRLLRTYIENLSKYNSVLTTHEPWRSEEIKKKLFADKDAFSDGLLMAELYVGDRIEHMKLLVEPALRAGAFVICDRYKMSTCAYQWAQGVLIDDLLKLHEHPDLLVPDLVILVDVANEIAEKRRISRGMSREKFEDLVFLNKVIEKYRILANLAGENKNLFGKVVIIDGSGTIEKIRDDIRQVFNDLYYTWQKNN